MSGHSKWANIKVRKGAADKKRSEAFTRVAKDILTAIRLGGGNTNVEANSYLRAAIDKAREVNMPKENVSRLLINFESRKANLVDYVFEGYGPYGVPLIIELQTDNKNRSLAEIKLILKNYNGNLGENGSVMYLFERRGEVELEALLEERQLELIDIGAQDFDGNTVIVSDKEINDFVKKVEEMGFKVKRAEVIMRAKMPVVLRTEEEVGRVLGMIEELEEDDDVVNVFAGFDYEQKS